MDNRTVETRFRPVSAVFIILVPDLMAGGPDNAGQSGVEPKNLGALSYADESPSSSSNEYAIDVNANLLFEE